MCKETRFHVDVVSVVYWVGRSAEEVENGQNALKTWGYLSNILLHQLQFAIKRMVASVKTRSVAAL